MTLSRRHCLLATLVLSSALHAGDKPAVSVNDLSQNGVQSAFQILRRDYIRSEELSFEELNRAALQGLLERLNFGAELIAKTQDETTQKAHVHSEFLAPGLAYIRPETFGSGEGELFTRALQDIVARSASHVILDLRQAQMGSFDVAAQMLECFVPEGEVLFKLRQIGAERAELFVSKRSPVWTGNVVLLLDSETGSAAETVAAVLQQRGRALMIGEKTRGVTVGYTELDIDQAARLRFASAEMLLPDDSSIFKKGLSPQFEVKFSAADKVKVFAKSQGKSLRPFVVDQVRPRYNEAALVHGTNPELDDYVRKSKGEPLPGDQGQLRDLVLQRAVDLLSTEQFVASAKIPWQPYPSAKSESSQEKSEEAPRPANSDSTDPK